MLYVAIFKIQVYYTGILLYYQNCHLFSFLMKNAFGARTRTIVRKDDIIEQNSKEEKPCCTRGALCGPVGHTSGSILCD